MTEKQYPLGSYTQDIYNFVSDEVFTGHNGRPPTTLSLPLPCDASFLQSKCKWNFLFKGLESPLISLCYEISGLISALSNSENRF